MWTVTLAELRRAGACVAGYNKVVSALKGIPFDASRKTYIHFAHKEPISILSILESNDFEDALWACRCLKNKDRDLRLLAVWCARQIEHLNQDVRVKNCTATVERFANGMATQEELDAARAAAWTAARAAAGAAAWDAVGAAAWAAAWAAAGAAAWAAVEAVEAAAGAAAGVTARAAQKETFIKMLNGQAPWQTQENT